MEFDVVVIGAGAAGLMCAYQAGMRGKKVALLDHSSKLAEKIRISGGGRCNFTNINASSQNYISNNKHFSKSALSGYTPYDFMELLDNHGITYHEKTLGQMFCDQKSQAIIDLLDNLCQQYNVTRIMSCSIQQVKKEQALFVISTSKGIFTSANLVIATGGLSIPQIGATAFGYELAKQFDIAITLLVPALVPLTLDKPDLDKLRDLSGISFDSVASCNNIEFQENSLITHKGFSGPAILQISSYYNAGDRIKVDLLPSCNITDEINLKRSSNKLLSNFLAEYFSARLAGALIKVIGFDKSISQLSKKDIALIENIIHGFSFIPSGTEGYKKAEVTRGGIDTNELDSKTMMSKKVSGLYFIGEVVDVTGWLGGYNFQWAWASAVACARNIVTF